jgi:multiple sugar transport system permease protein
MAIISNLDRRTLRGKLMMSFIYALLFAGSVGMIYPFLLMVRMTTSDDIDRDSISPLPAFLWDNDLFARKALNQQYTLVPQWLVAHAYGTDKWGTLREAADFWRTSFAGISATPPAAVEARAADYFAFAAQADLRFVLPALRYSPEGTFNERFIGAYLAKKEGVPRRPHQFFEPVRPDFVRRDWIPPSGRAWNQWRDWLGRLPGRDRFLVAPSWLWQRFLASRYGNNLSALRAAHGADYPSFAEGPRFDTRRPAGPPGLLDDWDHFVSTRYPLFWQELPPETRAKHTAAWQRWLAGAPGVGSPAAWTDITGLPPENGYSSLPGKMPDDETAAAWWARFVAAEVPVAERVLLSAEDDFAGFLKNKYGTAAALAQAWGDPAAGFAGAVFPVPSADFLTLTRHAAGIKWELSTQNFGVVTRSLVTEGRAFFNTFVIVALGILTSLTVNPLAAYALSRFRMRGTQKILVFLLATMALPAEVAMVPGFLLVRDLHLTDTFWALVLPGAANAFSIFLLKGFFDSLPQELYEAALIDGAGEFTLFTRITLPLSMPIIAVTLLGTVTHAYNLFMPAVMYLGDVTMWPIATKIYEINQTSPAGIGMAALVLSSVFPLLVFVFCQRIIMRGIILPSMK